MPHVLCLDFSGRTIRATKKKQMKNILIRMLNYPAATTQDAD
jgi:hypothetical protein